MAWAGWACWGVHRGPGWGASVGTVSNLPLSRRQGLGAGTILGSQQGLMGWVSPGPWLGREGGHSEGVSPTFARSLLGGIRDPGTWEEQGGLRGRLGFGACRPPPSPPASLGVEPRKPPLPPQRPAVPPGLSLPGRVHCFMD